MPGFPLRLTLIEQLARTTPPSARRQRAIVTPRKGRRDLANNLANQTCHLIPGAGAEQAALLKRIIPPARTLPQSGEVDDAALVEKFQIEFAVRRQLLKRQRLLGCLGLRLDQLPDQR